ncbi:hypothetical protein SAMN04487995_4289 [Dyadobacter koreensis]|uniref:Uncharacterized protein n=1 Tax=Dyadobacter koreensis TaxID=408657 RepID=A0A1H6Y4G1_9BACT|nr:hypothetical protein [Dyadobacter koreensis]SEJ33917.1 hypothetical protein SAMN04487995_4289 [Dyadobacter koreensis]
MNIKLSTVLLLLVLSVTDAYLLAHPNLIGKIGILVYKHSYIKTFPKALVTVLLVVGISLLIAELLYRFTGYKKATLSYGVLLSISVFWFGYVFVTFSSFSYRITGKAFIYGAHLLPIILIGLFGRYLVKTQLHLRKKTELATSEDSKKMAS